MGDRKPDPATRVSASNCVAVFASDAEAQLICGMLRKSGCNCDRPSVGGLVEGIRDGTFGTAIVFEEMIEALERPELIEAIESQPNWSDFPFIVIIRRESLDKLYARVRMLDHVAIIEPPIHPAILLNEVQAALYNRMRQREAEAYLRQRDIAEEHLRHLTATLERRVSERTREFEEANEHLQREVEERRAAEERLRESEELYRYTVELSQQTAWTADSEGHLLTVSPRFEQITGLPESAALGQGWHQVTHPDDVAGAEEAWAEAVRTRKPLHVRFRVRSMDGSYRQYSSRARPRLAEDGSVIRWYGILRDVEDEKRAEERLRESEELYRYTVDLSQQIAWSTDAEGKHVTISPRFQAITGVDVHGKHFDSWLSVIHPDDQAATLDLWGRALRSRHPYSTNYRMRVADGSYRLFNSSAMPRLAEDGSVIRWYGVTRDIEDQRQAEERLRESEELYRYTVELGQQIVWTADVNGNVEMMSPRFFAVTGQSEDEAFNQAFHPDDRDRVMESWSAAHTSGTPMVTEFRLRIADGSYRHFRIRAAPRRDEHGNIVRWYGTIKDIHEQRLADQARLEAEERYRLAARATDDAIWDLDLVKNEIRWSDSASIFFGYPGGEGFTSVSWWEDRIHPDDRERVLQSIREAREVGARRWASEYRFLSADGSYADVSDRRFIIRDRHGVPVRAVGAMADITERRRAEAEIRKMQAELIHVSRLSAMGAMASTLAHEINQPLTAVTSYLRGSRRLLEGTEAPPLDKVREAVEAAEAGALRAGQIVRRLRELVARGNVATKTEDLPKLIEDACVLGLVDAHVLGVSHRVELDPEAAWVEADRIQIEQVLINLIRNAIQAMKDRPVREVAIRTRAVPDDFVEISVEDTGIGFSEETPEALFSPFHSTKVEGMGIGLSISRTIVEAHGGKIWAENREGGGAAFHFTLRMSREGEAEGELDEKQVAQFPL